MSTSDYAIRIKDIGKQYRLGLEQSGGMYKYKSLGDTVATAVRSPLKTLRSTVLQEPMNESNSFWALKDVSLDVKRGEVVGIIGRNGAGKSTLLKILSRITRPTTGEIELHGRVGSLLEVGTGFHPELSGRENIYLNGAVLGMTRAEVKKKFDEIVSFSEIEKFLDTPVKHYSSGMYTRLAFAVAAHLEPEILVVDEVLAVGDIAFQRKCLGKMRSVANNGKTVLLVSHTMNAIASLCESAVLLNSGRIAMISDPGSVISHYTSLAGPQGSEWRSRSSQNAIRAARITDIHGNVIASAKSGSSFCIHIEYLSAGGDLTLGVGISTMTGQRVFTVSTEFLDQPPADLSKGFAICTITPPILVEGLYSLRIGLDEGRSVAERVEDVLRLEIVPIEGHRSPRPVHGVVEAHATWQFYDR